MSSDSLGGGAAVGALAVRAWSLADKTEGRCAGLPESPFLEMLAAAAGCTLSPGDMALDMGQWREPWSPPEGGLESIKEGRTKVLSFLLKD